MASTHGLKTDKAKKAPDYNAPACIIIEPTKELAEQTNGQLQTFKKYLEKPSIRFFLSLSRFSVGLFIFSYFSHLLEKV